MLREQDWNIIFQIQSCSESQSENPWTQAARHSRSWKAEKAKASQQYFFCGGILFTFFERTRHSERLLLCCVWMTSIFLKDSQPFPHIIIVSALPPGDLVSIKTALCCRKKTECSVQRCLTLWPTMFTLFLQPDGNHSDQRFYLKGLCYIKCVYMPQNISHYRTHCEALNLH